MKKKELLHRCGIADAHGIECYYELEKTSPSQLMMYFLRAESNRQRHAVAFVVEVDKKTDVAVNKLVTKFKFAEALSYLKENAKAVRFPKDSSGFYSKSWTLIPNAGLDPWS